MSKQEPNKGHRAIIMVGYLCQDCKIPIETIPNLNIALCPTHNKAYNPVIWTESPKGNKIVGIGVFSEDQRKVLFEMIDNTNDAWKWIMTHEHAEPMEETGGVLSDRIGQVEDRLAAVESVLDEDE